MSLSQNLNIYSSTATELQALPTMTEETKLYREAALAVIAKPENRKAGRKERDLILTRRTLDDLMETVNEARGKNKLLNTGDLSRVSKLARSTVNTLGRFEKAITSIAQSKSEILMPIWGSIQFLVRIAAEIFDTLERLNEIGERLQHCLERYKVYTAGDPLSGPLRRSLVDFYIHVIQFSITASQIYWKRRIKMATFVFKTSVQKPFEQFMKGLEYLSGVVDKDAHAESYQDIKSIKKTWPQSPGTLIPRSTTIGSGDTTCESTAGSIPMVRHIMVPDLLSGTFYGREDVLECVHRSLLRGRQTSEISRTAIWGLPGIGKTQIALCYERRHRSDYRHVFFVNASGAETIVTTYRAFLQALFPDKTGFDRLDNAEVEKLMKAWLARNPNWLLIYDNAISPGAVRQYTPVDGRGHIIFTTRNEIAAEALVEREEAFEIFALPPQHAVPFILLLQKIVLDAASTHDEQVAQHLAKTLLGIPIAIEQSVLLARLRNVPLSTILPEVETRRTLFQQTHPASMHEYECSTGALVSMTLETLATRSPPAASLFQLLVFCHTSSIPIEMITKGSKQLDFHFARQEIYNQGLRRSAQEIQEMRLQSAGRRPFYEENPFEKSFWKSRIPFQAKPKSNQLPRVDSAADKAVEKFYKGNHVLRDVLEKEVRIENAILDLKEAGLVRSPNDKTIWIHDLFAQLTIASVEEESQELARNVAHLVLLTIYLSFPIPYAGINSQLCDLHLPHAMSILRHCAPFYKYLTMGPELAHMTASALSLTNAKDQSPEYKKDLIHYYKLALFGYHSAWQRLRAHPHVYDADILNHARTEWKLERSRGYREVFSAHYIWDQRFGSTPAPRTLQTTLQIGKVYSIWEDHVLAARWTLVAVQGISVLYGDLHAETEKYRKVLLRIYMDFNLWTFAESHALLMAKKYVERNGGEISLLGGGGWIAEAIGDCSLGLHYLTKAKSFYEIALLDLTYIWGGNDRSQFGILLKLANVERLRHNHAESLQYALKDEKIYQDSLQDSDTFPATARLIDIQVAIASQHFEMGNLGAAKEWCERAFQGPEWNPEIDRNIVVRKRSIWLSRLEAIWIWGCVEHGETDVREWEIPNFNMITKDITREALSTHGPLKRPCCGPGSDAQLNRYGAMTVAEFGAAMFKILDEPHGTDPDEEPVRD